MKENTEKEIRDHSIRDFPREACGFIIKKGSAEVCFPCKNIAEHSVSQFIISPEDYLKAKEEGDILAIYHSHSTGGPSQADKASCEKTGLPWYVYSNGKIHELYPAGVRIPLLGRKFVWGTFDCWTLVRDYYEYNLNIILPDFNYEEKFWEKGINMYLDNYEKAGFAKVDIPQEYDALLFQMNSRIPNHAAVLLGDNRIIHHMSNRLSCRDIYGGYWKFVTVGIYRHEKFR